MKCAEKLVKLWVFRSDLLSLRSLCFPTLCRLTAPTIHVCLIAHLISKAVWWLNGRAYTDERTISNLELQKLKKLSSIPLMHQAELDASMYVFASIMKNLYNYVIKLNYTRFSMQFWNSKAKEKIYKGKKNTAKTFLSELNIKIMTNDIKNTIFSFCFV